MTIENQKVAATIERFSDLVGRATSWLTLLMVLTTFGVVVLRYIFDAGIIWLQEAITWMHATVFMLGAAYALQQEEHVRVDIFYRDMTARGRAIVNIGGLLLFLWPMCGYLMIEALDYVSASWALRESSREAGGLPYPFVPLLKSLLLLMPLTVALQGLAIFLRALPALKREH